MKKKRHFVIFMLYSIILSQATTPPQTKEQKKKPKPEHATRSAHDQGTAAPKEGPVENPKSYYTHQGQALEVDTD